MTFPNADRIVRLQREQKRAAWWARHWAGFLLGTVAVIVVVATAIIYLSWAMS